MNDETTLVWVNIFVISLLVQLGFYYIFRKLGGWKNSSTIGETTNWPPLSVIICAKNEAKNLAKNLPVILSQNYRDFEVLVVNDGSTDETKEVLENLKLNHFNLKTVEQFTTSTSGGKKNALEKGVSCAANDCLILTDADCFPSSENWLKKLSLGFGLNKEITLGYSPYVKHATVLNKLIRFDTYLIAKHYFSFALAGIPYMGVGRNMGYRKKLFFNQQGFASHKDLLSGDDDLFLNQTITPTNHYLVIDKEAWTYSIPKTTFKEWVKQKKRHLTTAPRYRFIHKTLLISFPLSLFLFYISFLLLLGNLEYGMLALITGMFIFKILVQLVVYYKPMRRLEVIDLWLLSPLLEIIVIGINGILFFTNIFFKPNTWN